MIQRILALSLASCFAAAISASSDQAAAPSTGVGKLTVVPVGLEKDRGNAMIQLARGEADFEGGGEGEPFRFAIVKVENKEAVAVFEDVPHGEYAIKVFHDENGNQKLDTNFVGMPKEKFGFSNNVMGRFGPPSYEQARFRFEAEAATVEIEMR
jgi:uncharacterized protein (DUF2141 family)